MATKEPNPHYDPETKVIRVIYGGEASVEDSIATLDALPDLIAECGCRRVLTFVVGTPDYMSRADRQRIADAARKSSYDKEAVVTTNPMVRMLARAINLVSSRTHTIRYFAREDEALVWLNEDGEG